MYQIAICDDEETFAKHTKKLVSAALLEAHIPHQIHTFLSPLLLLELLEKEPTRFHILILDIVMEETDGIALAKVLRKKGNNVSILFTTVSKDFSLESYNVGPLHYLVKPIDPDVLAEVLKRDYAKNSRKKHILIKGKVGQRVLCLNDIIYIESYNRKTLIHFASKTLPYYGTLRDLQGRLPDDIFIQCHKSFLVSIYNIKHLTRQLIFLSNEKEIPIGRVYYDSLYTKLIEYLDQK